MRASDPEISDLVVDYDSETLTRLPVSQAEVAATFRDLGNRRAARIVEQIPASGGVLDNAAVDALLIRCHCELQRLHEEFQHGRRVLRWLRPLVATLRSAGHRIRIVDIGCGLGFVVRWLTAFGELGPDVELCGVDYNAAFIDAARELARREDINCQFVVGNAFTLSEPATVFISSGVVHHFRGPGLEEFFAAQAEAVAFAHWDIAKTWLSTAGAWIFHVARMREALARHDGVLSAMRAYSDDQLLRACRSALPSMRTAIYDSPNPVLPIFRVLRPAVGYLPELETELHRLLGPLATRLQGLQ